MPKESSVLNRPNSMPVKSNVLDRPYRVTNVCQSTR